MDNRAFLLDTWLMQRLDLENGRIEGAAPRDVCLHDLRDCFADPDAFAESLDRGNPLVYRVSSIQAAEGEGQLHYGLGMLMPGRVGAEYYLTKGHFHAWRPAAEIYVGLRGEGRMLLEPEGDGESRLLEFGRDRVVYVPGHTAHRTINTGSEPLLYLGIYPSAAGYDYGALAERNFRHVVVAKDFVPTLVDRTEWLSQLSNT